MNYLSTSDGTQLYLKDWGQGPSVILVHGWPLSSDSWDDQAMAIAEAGYRVITYDRRGFGRSSQASGGYDFDTLADDLAAVIDYTETVDAVLVGFSMGGGEIARYMSRHEGKNVVKTALVSSILPFLRLTGSNPFGTAQSVFDEMIESLKQDRPKFLAGFFNDFFSVSIIAKTVSDPLLEWARTVSMQAGLTATIECAKIFASTDFRDELKAFKVPTLIIHGTDDKTVPIDASARAAVKAIAHATLIEYEGAPHGLFATEKTRLAHDLLEFIRR
jgi:non-heme chloroperoxidase